MKNRCRLPALFVLLVFAACSGTDYSLREPAPRLDTIDISEVRVTLPDSMGKELVEANCITCHSLRYIEMQPHMSRKNWEKTVTKMIKTYGATVTDSMAAAAIIDYLMRIKGAG